MHFTLYQCSLYTTISNPHYWPGQGYFYLHFLDEIEAQRGEFTCLRLGNRQVVKPRLKSKSSDSKSILLLLHF